MFFLNVLFQHASFIAEGVHPERSLADTSSPDHSENGLLAFVRLVGCVYFKKHLALFKHETPEALFHSIVAASTQDQHKEWLEQTKMNSLGGKL